MEVDVKSLWGESPTRPAGFRQTIKIGDAEYGFRWIPAGEFDMGSPLSEQEEASANANGIHLCGFDDEILHHVKLTRGFWMLETPTTQALYQEVVGTNPSCFKGDDLPVETVSWREAVEFCEKLTRRLPEGVKASLPTEAQWEYAARAGTTTPYSFGSALNGDMANCDGEVPFGTDEKGPCLGKTSPVKSYPANPWGLYDMHGDVFEWLLDYYGDYPTGTVVDPTGAKDPSYRVTRGGSWSVLARFCRSAFRCDSVSDNRVNDLGFRFLLIYD